MSDQKIDFSYFREQFPDAVIGKARIMGDSMIVYDEMVNESHLYSLKDGCNRIASYKDGKMIDIQNK